MEYSMADTPATTTSIVITDAWSKIADGDSTVQSVNDRDTYSKTFYDMVVSATEPPSDTEAFIRITLDIHANFHRPTPVWLRLSAINVGQDQPVVVIK